MPSAENANIILQSLQRAGIDVVASLPDAFLVHVLEGLDASNEFLHLPVTREEEGIGICTGAYLGGKRTCMVMQNAGLLNASNALTTTALQIEVPMLLLPADAATCPFPCWAKLPNRYWGRYTFPTTSPNPSNKFPISSLTP